MRSVDAHLQAILELVALAHPTPRTESVPLSDAAGRVTGSAHVAASQSPPFDNSAMDGFAVRAADLAGASSAAPVSLRVVGEARAGHAATATVEPGTAIRIMTGAPIPQGADAVVAQELVVAHEGAAQFAAPAAPGAHVRRAGEDVRVGDLVLAAHVKLSARHLAALASAGLSHVSVTRAPRVGYLVTGDELVAPGQPLGPAQIFDSNATYLRAALGALGAEAIDLGRCGDDPAAVRAIVEGAAVDLVVTTGGASVGAARPREGGPRSGWRGVRERRDAAGQAAGLRARRRQAGCVFARQPCGRSGVGGDVRWACGAGDVGRSRSRRGRPRERPRRGSAQWAAISWYRSFLRGPTWCRLRQGARVRTSSRGWAWPTPWHG